MFTQPSYVCNSGLIPIFNEVNRIRAYRTIEHAARICYHSNVIETYENEMKEFLNRLYRSGHMSVFEHSNFIVRVTQPVCSSSLYSDPKAMDRWQAMKAATVLSVLESQKHLTTGLNDKGEMYIGGNLRAWIEALDVRKTRPDLRFTDITPALLVELYQERLQSLKDIDIDVLSTFNVKEVEDVEGTLGLCIIPENLQRFGVEIIHDRAFTHELVRHRVMSFSMESQRYCNYAKDKFGRSVTFINPENLKSGFKRFLFLASCWIAEKVYLGLVDMKTPAQIARGVLPNACKTRIYVSGDTMSWRHLFKLRITPAAHPDMRSTIKKVETQFITTLAIAYGRCFACDMEECRCH